MSNLGGHFFREDKESSGKVRLPGNNLDISSKGNACQGISGFFSAISQYAVIHTDRLHVSIACALMSKKCYLYPGNYFKNESVFRASIEPYTDCVRFVSSDFFNA
jgi:exopolysaccharide biosynthesis predicted pyruvyltransferase EpsI